MNKSGIYKILNLISNKFYIGSAKNLRKRWNIHLCLLRKNKHYNIALQRAFNKYGVDAFQFQIIEFCEPADLIKKEQFYIDTLKPKYNMKPTAGNSLGFKHSEISRTKMSKSHKGFKQSEKQKLTHSLNMKGNNFRLGIPHTKETIDKLVIIRKGKTPSRKINKWPHELGIKCKCEECKTKYNSIIREWYNKRKLSNANV